MSAPQYDYDDEAVLKVPLTKYQALKLAASFLPYLDTLEKESDPEGYAEYLVPMKNADWEEIKLSSLFKLAEKILDKDKKYYFELPPED